MKLLLVSPHKAHGIESALQNLSVVSGAEFKYFEDIIYYSPVFKNQILKKGYRKIQREIGSLNLNTLKGFSNNIILGGWDYPYNILTDKLNEIGIYPSVMWCSTIGQAEMTSTEIARFVELLQYIKAGKVRFLLLHRGLYETLNYINNVVFLPHTIDITRVKTTAPKKFEGLNADLFCSYRYGKNVITQILAGKLARTRPTIHINFNSPELQQIIQILNIKDVVSHSWIDDSEYWNFLAGMTLSLQVTHTESFNYAVCERMIIGIPALVTHNIWLVSEEPYLKQHLCVDSPDNPLDIANKIDLILTNKTLYKELGEKCKERVKKIAQNDNSIALEMINKYFK